MPDETQEHPQEQLSDAEAQAEQQEEQAPALPDIAVAAEDAGVLKKKLTVTVPRERIDAKLNEMYGELLHTAQVPGFRVGRAPRRLIEKRFGKEVASDVRNALIGESIGQAIEKSDLKTLGEPDIDLDKIELPEAGEMSFSFEVEIAPTFDLPELKGIEVKKPALAIDDERVDRTLEEWRQGQARFEVTDKAAQADDMVQAGAKISVEGQPALESPGLSLRVAPGQIEGLPLVDLADALAGKKAGDAVAMKLTVPQAHPNEAWRGKEATVELAVSQVRRQVLPKIDEAFASSLGYDSLEQLRGDVRQRLAGTVEREARRALRDQVCAYLMEKTAFDLPEGVVARHTAQVLQRRLVDLLQRGVPRNRIDENLTELQAAAGEQAQRDLKLTFILGKIAEQESIEAADEEINARVAEVASMYGRRPERLRQELESDGTIETLALSVRDDKVLDKLLADAKVTEVAPEDLAAEQAAQAEKKEKKHEKKAEKHEKKSEEKPKKAEKHEKAPEKKAEKKPAKKTDKQAGKDADKKPAKKPSSRKGT